MKARIGELRVVDTPIAGRHRGWRTWPILCGSCGHEIGTTVGRFSTLRDLIPLTPAEDGVPRFGLREGAFRHGRDPVRRDWMTTVGWTRHADGTTTMGERSNGHTTDPVFYAYCTNCRRRNLVDARGLSAMMDGTDETAGGTTG